MEIEKYIFDDFIRWLIMDGLKPRTSERIWKKAIYINLKYDDPMTLENFKDYMKYVNRKKLPLKKDISVDVDYFDYSVVVNQDIPFDGGNKKILRYVNTEGFLHLFFDDHSDDLISKEVIRKRFSKTSYT